MKRKPVVEKSKSRKKPKRDEPGEERDTLNFPKAQYLGTEGVHVGMLLLGCVVAVNSKSVLFSLPGCLLGRIPSALISRELTKRISEGDSTVDLSTIIQPGMLFPCKVMQVETDAKKKTNISLSVDPMDVNSDLTPECLYPGMVLHVSVRSVEDHGFLVSMGLRGVEGFLPFEGGAPLSVGRVLPALVRSVSAARGARGTVLLSRMDTEDTPPLVENDSQRLISILPGAKLPATIVGFHKPFLQLRCMDFNACALMLGKNSRNTEVGAQVTGRVLYVHPVTHLIYLRIGALPSPARFESFFGLKQYDRVKNSRFFSALPEKLLLKVGRKMFGFVKESEFHMKGEESAGKMISKQPIITLARVCCLHYVDRLVQLSLKPSFLKLQIRSMDKIAVGEILEAAVFKYTDTGMVMKVCPKVFGFVRRTHISDVPIFSKKKPYAIGRKMQCRVLSVSPEKGMSLTCKDSLLSASDSELLFSYEMANPGEIYVGTVVYQVAKHMRVSFLNGVEGVVPGSYIPPSSVFYGGQTVRCTVILSDAHRNSLALSLMDDPLIGGTAAKSTSQKRKSLKRIPSLRRAKETTKKDLNEKRKRKKLKNLQAKTVEILNSEDSNIHSNDSATDTLSVKIKNRVKRKKEPRMKSETHMEKDTSSNENSDHLEVTEQAKVKQNKRRGETSPSTVKRTSGKLKHRSETVNSQLLNDSVTISTLDVDCNADKTKTRKPVQTFSNKATQSLRGAPKKKVPKSDRGNTQSLRGAPKKKVPKSNRVNCLNHPKRKWKVAKCRNLNGSVHLAVDNNTDRKTRPADHLQLIEDIDWDED